MNKSILKHEIRSMKWMLLLSVLFSCILVIIFSVNLNSSYEMMFSNGINGNQALIQRGLRDVTPSILGLFTLISIVQIFMQFRSEKTQETGRFLKSLPISKEEFFKIKLLTGIVNLTLAFIVLILGIIIVRNNNMFWIKDIYSISTISQAYMKLDGIGTILKEVGLIYLVVLSFYSFLFMIQYTFSNVIGAIVTGILVWLAPVFIVITSIFTLGKISPISLYNSRLLNNIDNFAEWLLPHLYPLDYLYEGLYTDSNMTIGTISTIDKLQFKYMIVIVLILVNIIIAYKFNKSSRVENENKIIVFKSSQNIFKFGVTICSGLLVATVLNEIIRLQINSILYGILILLGGFIGYLISRKITKVGNI